MREMKDSNIQWVGKIPYNWKVEKNKHCFELEKNIVGVYNKTQHLEKIPLLPFSKKMPKGKMCPKKWLYFFEILQCRLDLIDDFIFDNNIFFFCPNQ